MPTVSVHFLPALIPIGALDGGVAVVVDVLRASTAMVHAIQAGASAILPCGEIDEARAVASSLPAGSALLAGERQGVPIAGFDLGNSPESFTPEVCRDKTIVMTTTNGTRAILASQGAGRVLIGAFVNLDAIEEALIAEDKDVHVVCAGTDGAVSFEDSLLAGRFVRDLGDRLGWPPANDAAIIAAKCWEAVERGSSGLEAILAIGRGGRRVSELGLDADRVAAAREGTIDLVPELRGDPPRIVRAGATDGLSIV